MTTLWVYGDSFSAQGSTLNEFAWPTLLAKKLDVNVINHSVSGGSTEYAMQCLFKDVNSENYQDGDTIIFVVSTPGRFHFKFQNNRPETAAQYYHSVNENDPQHFWYKENKQYLKWYIVNCDYFLLRLNHECYIHAIKNLAESKPKCKFVLLANSDHLLAGDGVHAKLPMGVCPPNFFRPDIFLNQISVNEYNHSVDTYNDFVLHTGWDPRINHLCNPNLNILADLVYTAVTTGKLEDFTYDSFNQMVFNQIRSVDDYSKYIDQGLLYHIPAIERTLKKRS
jgi:hypothetical protein